MPPSIFRSTYTRRDFIKQAAAAGCALGIGGLDSSLFAAARVSETEKTGLTYRHAIMSVDHLEEMQRWHDGLLAADRLSDHEIYRSYIDRMKYALPEDFADAKSIVLLATLTIPMMARFHHKGKIHDLILPPQYSDDGVTVDTIKTIIGKEIIGSSDARVERVRGMFVKPLAVRSGLGLYGRNNIVFVDGMGSFITLYAFFTDYVPESYTWYDMAMMDYCDTCRICLERCPNGCITEENFVIDAGRCLTLFNEVAGDFPDWIDRGSHNALMGCMRCQDLCPGNREVAHLSGRLEDIDEEETGRILAGKGDEKLFETLSRKLNRYYPAGSAEHFPIFTRNLAALIG